MDKEEHENETPSLPDFEAQVKAGAVNPHPYDRLMIAYRKEKNYKDELRVVKRAIAVFEAHLSAIQAGILKGNRKRARILALSKSISQKTGLMDKKGKALHTPEPIARWQKRKETIEQKIKAASVKPRKRKN